MDEIHPAKHRESKSSDQFMDEFVSLSDSTQDNKALMKKIKCILKNTHWDSGRENIKTSQ